MKTVNRYTIAPDANLRDANLRCANLCCADLCDANLSGADLYGADLSGADLYGADLSGADLCCADLYGADLSGADLSGADLYGADLSGADLSGADLRRANLSGANLSGADLYGADLSGADLSGAIGFLLLPVQDARGYSFAHAIRTDDGWRIRAGCRDFTPEEALAHWGESYEGDRRQGDMYLHAVRWFLDQPEARDANQGDAPQQAAFSWFDESDPIERAYRSTQP